MIGSKCFLNMVRPYIHFVYIFIVKIDTKIFFFYFLPPAPVKESDRKKMVLPYKMLDIMRIVSVLSTE